MPTPGPRTSRGSREGPPEDAEDRFQGSESLLAEPAAAELPGAEARKWGTGCRFGGRQNSGRMSSNVWTGHVLFQEHSRKAGLASARGGWCDLRLLLQSLGQPRVHAAPSNLCLLPAESESTFLHSTCSAQCLGERPQQLLSPSPALDHS